MRKLRAIALTVLAASQILAAAGPITKDQWREDLRFYAKEMAKRHKNLYHATPRERFERAIADLDAAIPSLEDHQIVVRLQQIAALVGDGHTRVHIPASFRMYPLALYWYGRELRVQAAGADYTSALGTRVVAINGVPIDEVQARVRTCFPSAENENEWYVLATSPAFIVRPEVLHTLGIVSGVEGAPFTFKDDDGRESTIDVTPIAVQPVSGAVTLAMTPAAKQPPLFRQRPTEAFWFTDLPDTKTTYAVWRRYTSLGDRAKELFAHVDSHKSDRLVIDMRQNGGGDFFEGRKHMIAPVKQRPALNQKGRVYVIVGRQTFSAALANAIDFKKDTNAIIVGEPIGERPNSYSENNEMTLPNSRLVVSYSSKYYKFLDEDVPAFIPDQRIDPEWPAFKAGRDPVLEWIQSRK